LIRGKVKAMNLIGGKTGKHGAKSSLTYWKK